MLVVFAGVAWLPPAEAWYSGLMPYRWLLPSQWLIIVGLAAIVRTFARGRPVRPRAEAGRWLTGLGAAYAGVMLARYSMRMALYPTERWGGGAIPIAFHLVLAAIVLTLGHYHRRHTPSPAPWTGVARWATGALAVAAAVAWVGWQLGPWWLGRSLACRPGDFAVRVTRDAETVADDGTLLRSDVFRPARLAKTPTILVRLPRGNSFKHFFAITLTGRFWAEHGYTAVIQAVRGRHTSGGTYAPFVHERADGLATLRWIAQQPWYDGHVGTWGGSYFGYTQWAIADAPAVQAMIVLQSATDFYSSIFPGGAFSLQTALSWAAGARDHDDVTLPADRLAAAAVGFPIAEADQRASGQASFFADWAAHDHHDDFWRARDASDALARSRAPVLLMGGWFDPFMPGLLADWAALARRESGASSSRLVLGPWTHARTVPLPGGFAPPNFRLESLAPSVAWFDRWLREGPPPADVAPNPAPVRIFLMGQNVWRDEQAWPLERAVATRLYLHSDGLADFVAPPADAPAATYTYDPRRPAASHGGAVLSEGPSLPGQPSVPTPETPAGGPASGRDRLIYRTPPLAAPMEISGPLSLDFSAQTTATCSEFVATFSDVHPDGTAYAYAQGAVRHVASSEDARATETAGLASNGSERPDRPAHPPVRLAIELWPTSLHVPAGHRLEVVVASASHPRFAHHPNRCADWATTSAPEVAQQTVYHDRERPAYLTLPTVAPPASPLPPTGRAKRRDM